MLEQVLKLWIFNYKIPKYNSGEGHKTIREYNLGETKAVKFGEFLFE